MHPTDAPLRPAVFLDRDGTLIEECCYLTRPQQVRLLPGAADAVRRLRGSGWACVVVTNQSAIGRGLMTEDDLGRVHLELLRQLGAAGAWLDGIYHCPRAPLGHDKTVIEHPDRKPGPGMLLRAGAELRLDLTRSWIVGDSLSDLLAGRNAGCHGAILVQTGHPIDPRAELPGPNCHVAVDLAEAAGFILGDQADEAVSAA